MAREEDKNIEYHQKSTEELKQTHGKQRQSGNHWRTTSRSCRETVKVGELATPVVGDRSQGSSREAIQVDAQKAVWQAGNFHKLQARSARPMKKYVHQIFGGAAVVRGGAEQEATTANRPQHNLNQPKDERRIWPQMCT